jgi:hypothetical protein
MWLRFGNSHLLWHVRGLYPRFHLRVGEISLTGGRVTVNILDRLTLTFTTVNSFLNFRWVYQVPSFGGSEIDLLILRASLCRHHVNFDSRSKAHSGPRGCGGGRRGRQGRPGFPEGRPLRCRRWNHRESARLL